MKVSYQIVTARLENERAAAPYSRSRIPRPGLKPGWNLEEAPAVASTASPADELSAASRARLARLTRQAAPAPLAPRKDIQATLAQGVDKVVFLPTGKFKTLKNGQLREIKTRVEIWNRQITIGTTLYHFSSSAKAVTLFSTVELGREYSVVNDADLRAAKIRRSKDQVEAAFRRILPDRADELIRHLFRA